MTPELLKLVSDYGDASFECGEWGRKDPDETYETVYGRFEAARDALMEAIDRSLAEIHRLNAGRETLIAEVDRLMGEAEDYRQRIIDLTATLNQKI